MSKIYSRLEKCYNCVKSKISFVPDVALVLGSGLGDYADGVEIAETLSYREIEDFPVSTVAGHKGRFVFGTVNGVKVVVMQGRVHYYEGYSMEDVVLPIRLMKMMGAKILFLTNAAGGVNFGFHAGDFMLISDQICLAPSPLIGENADELGVRFPDMSNIYDVRLREVVRSTAKKLDIPLQEGVYIQLTGPNYESPAEIRMVRTLGADAVGMSTACEAIAANHAGMRVVGISCISNMACGITDKPLTHAEVQETADRAAPLFKRLITEAVTELNQLIINN
ncbi:MAG: purine-nucleoside phosphorylase [Muribaculaceae bacterium]|nr:purine-nucleoside phosphorylase [Muribaculaceae bacterium]MCM1478121.1 purine-nucleoside phosphorylase [Muribaculaceae bacterium]